MEVSKAGAVLLIPVDKIRTNPNQPRKYFDPDELSSLGESIRRNGILQPLSVRAEDGDGKYELIAGERRLRAAAESGFDRVPCIVINADSTQAAVYSVIENLQRRDLNFFEEALAIESLGERYGLDRAQLSEKLGKAPSTLSNKLRLLRLPEDIRDMLTVDELVAFVAVRLVAYLKLVENTHCVGFYLFFLCHFVLSHFKFRFCIFRRGSKLGGQ